LNLGPINSGLEGYPAREAKIIFRTHCHVSSKRRLGAPRYRGKGPVWRL